MQDPIIASGARSGRQFHCGSCVATLDERGFELRNEVMVRRWRINGCTLESVQVDDLRSGRSWIQPPAAGQPAAVRLLQDAGRASPVEATSLRVTVVVTAGAYVRRYQFQMFPGVAAVRWRIDDDGPTAAGAAPITGVEIEPAEPVDAAPDGQVDRLMLAARHARLLVPELFSQTDHHYELVQLRRWENLRVIKALDLRGNVACVEDAVDGGGFVLLRHGMLPQSCPPPRRGRVDMTVSNNCITIFDHAGPLGDDGFGDWHAMLLYPATGPGADVAARCAAIQSYERCLRRRETAPVRMLSNTWGDRGRDGKLNETFMLTEVAAAQDLAIDVVQIDDGWQNGRTSNSAAGGGKWSDFWSEGDFWAPHPVRFPGGLAPIRAALAANQQSLGLWYAPDSADDFANWRRDVDLLLALHRRHGVDHFKLDAMTIRSRAGEANVHRMLDALLRESEGRIVLDLDTTASTRLDYLGRPDAGPVFVENRYTDWGNYYPHLTLRALWQLAHWLAPGRLRMEWLNPDRNREKYDDDDPLAPHHHGADYLFAITMLACPLAWMEVQNLSAARRNEVRPLIRLWKQHRDALHAGVIVPVGDAPTGGSWTGFAVLRDGRPGVIDQLLVFREPCASATASIMLPGRLDDAEVLYGDVASLDLEPANATVRLTLPRRRSIAWIASDAARRTAGSV